MPIFPQSEVRRLVTGRYYASGIGGFGSAVIANGDLYVIPLYVPHPVVVTAIGCNVVTTPGGSGSVIRMGIFSIVNGRPAAVLVDGGTVASTTTGGKSVSVSLALARGVYGIAIVAQGAASPAPTVAGDYQDFMLDPSYANTTDLYGCSGAWYRSGQTSALAAMSGSEGTTAFQPRVGILV